MKNIFVIFILLFAFSSSANEQSKTLHPSLKEFIKNELVLKTEKFLIRVDTTEEILRPNMRDENKYRYAAWDINKSMGETPDIIIYNGELVLNGGGSGYKYYQYKFKNGEYIYIVSDRLHGVYTEIMGPYSIQVYRGETLILDQRAERFDLP
ncbi:MAG: hypothetical protein FWF97_03090 [Alphaproteobacteria bacterium]|nr:hypothetical protein [Alphaproteobacteria bacterium]